MAYFIGIDIGASFVKGALLDLGKMKIRDIEKYPTPQSTIGATSSPLRFEVEGKQYVEIARKIIKGYVQEYDIEGIVLSTQMHGMILVDSENAPLTSFIGWQDERLLELDTKTQRTWLEILRKKLERVDVTKTGITMRSGLMGSTLFWLQEHNMIPSGSKALFLGDYVACALTSGKACVDATNACGSGLFNTERSCWDESVCHALNIPLSVLPEIVQTGTSVGNLNIRGKEIPVYVSIGDLQAAVLGSLVKEKTELSINVGTGSQVSVIGSKFQAGAYDIRSFFDNKYLYTVTHLPAGRALNVIISLLRNIGQTVFNTVKSDVEIWNPLLKSIDGKKESGGLQATIAFFRNNATSANTGSFSSISETNFTIQNLLYSALSDMTENYYEAFKKLPNHVKIIHIICSGGVIRQISALRHTITRKFGIPLDTAQYDEETLVGLYILALYCRRDFDTIEAAAESVIKNPIRF